MEQYNETDPIIMQLLETKAFGDLDADEKQLVLSQYTASEYNDLYHTLSVLGKHVKNKNHESKEKVRANLLEEFDALFPDKPTGKVFNWGNMFRYAAVLILSAGVSWIFFKPGKTDNSTLMASMKDTVYVETVKLLPQLIRDTIFVNIAPVSKVNKKPFFYVSSEYTPLINPDNRLLNDVNIVKVNELNSLVNESKGRSIRDDSLIAAVGFLTY